MTNENTTRKIAWYAMYTKPRHEFKAVLQLDDNNIEHFLPTITRLKQWSDRKKKITEPLFRGYIFIYGTEKDRLNALQQTAIVRSIIFNGEPATIPDWQIENLIKMLEGKPDVSVVNELKAGTKIKVISGPFQDVEGTVYESNNNEQMLAISIELLRRSVVVRLPAESVIKKV